MARAANNTNVHRARLIAGVFRKPVWLFTDISLASGKADVLVYAVCPANAYCSGTDKRTSRILPVARAVSSRRRNSGRAMELVTGHESFLALSNRGALSILDASFKCARPSFLIAGEPWSTACGAKSIWRNPVSSPQ